MNTDLSPREPAIKGEGEGNGGIKMCTGDVTNRIHHDHDNKAPCHANSWKRDRAVYFIDGHRPTSGKHHKKRPQHLGNQLLNQMQANVTITILT